MTPSHSHTAHSTCTPHASVADIQTAPTTTASAVVSISVHHSPARGGLFDAGCALCNTTNNQKSTKLGWPQQKEKHDKGRAKQNTAKQVATAQANKRRRTTPHNKHLTKAALTRPLATKPPAHSASTARTFHPPARTPLVDGLPGAGQSHICRQSWMATSSSPQRQAVRGWPTALSAPSAALLLLLLGLAAVCCALL